MNKLYEQYNKGPGGNFVERFQQFRKQFSGNPQQMIQQMLNSGQITQEQFNRAAQTANQLMRYFK